MNNTLLILLSGLLLYGCSQKHAPPARSASELVEAGKDIAWSDGYVLHVTRREGLTLGGIRIVKTETNGRVFTITADRGTLDSQPRTQRKGGVILSTIILTITLHDVQVQGVTSPPIKELTLFLHQ
jgi:hypothetical protein